MQSVSEIVEYWDTRKKTKPLVNLIACIGRDGRIGLNGNLPWKEGDVMRNNKALAAQVKYDLRFFQDITRDSILVVGRNTWPSVADLDYTHNRLFLIDGADTKMDDSGREEEWDFNTPLRCAHQHFIRGDKRNEIFIAGGAKTYRKWAPYIDKMILSYVDYSGPADTYFPEDAFMIKQWEDKQVLVDYRTFKV